MALYRVRQFYNALTLTLTEEDKKFISKYLNKEELKLFNKLQEFEKKHCVNVSYDLKKIYDEKNIEDKDLIKAALLHDVGKTYLNLNPVEKSVMVLADKISMGKAKKYKKIKKVGCYYYHAEYGYNMLKNINCNDKVLYLTKNHHNNDIIGDEDLNNLRLCDDRN